jgi:hypothetical protein
MSFNLSTLVGYRDELALQLKGKLLWGGDSLQYFQKVPGTTNIASINYFDVNPTIREGQFCTQFSASGATPINQKDISVCDIIAEDFWCENDLQKYYFTNKLKGVSGDTLGPWEMDFLGQTSAKILQTNEVRAWNYSSSCAQGLYQQISASVGYFTSGSAVPTKATILADVEQMVTSLVANAPNISQGDDLMLFMSPVCQAYFMQAIFAANPFQAPLITDAMGDITIDYFGPRIKIHRTYGLTGTTYMVLTTLKNLYYAFDGVSDAEKVSLWYEQYQDQLCYRAKYRMGVTFWLSEYIVANF